jgi:hypothetical protein
MGVKMKKMANGGGVRKKEAPGVFGSLRRPRIDGFLAGAG